jgi:hypothetical protein
MVTTLVINDKRFKKTLLFTLVTLYNGHLVGNGVLALTPIKPAIFPLIQLN